MKISFPYMGTSHIAFKMLVRDLGHEPIVPPKPSKKTLTYGTKNSPEFACLPFKILMGTYIEAIEQGAELIITSGGSGPCRAGYYGVLHQKILEDLGYDTKIMVMESPFQNVRDFFGKIRSVIVPSGVSWWKFVKVFYRAWEKLKVLDDIEILSHEIRPFEVSRGETTKIYKKCLEIIDEASTMPQIREAKEAAVQMLNGVSQDRHRKVLKVGIVGEIYVVLEPFANHDLEITLGEMGVQTHRSIYLSDWTRESTGYESTKKVKEAASPYIDELFGGHGICSVGHSILYSKKGFDGVVQLAPFTCIPEIVAKPILAKVTEDYGIPVLTIFLDEQTGKAGQQTRLEAFVDLLAQKRDKLEGIAI